MDSGEREPVELEGFSRILGRWFRAEARPSEDGLTLLIREVTDRRRQESLTRLHAATSRALGPAQGPSDVLRSTLQALHEVTGFEVGELWTRDLDAGGFTLDAVEHVDEDAALRFVAGSRDLELGAGSLIARAFEAGEVVVTDDTTDPASFHRAQLAQGTGMRRAISLPIVAAATPDAVLCLVSSLPPGHDDWFGVLRDFHPELVDRVDHQRVGHDLERLLQLSQDILVVARLDGYFLRVNPRFGELLGYDGEELLARPFTSFIHPDDHHDTARIVTELYRGRPVQAFTNRYFTADGDLRVLSWKSSPVPEEGVAYAVARDITQEHLERNLEDVQRDVLRSILTSSDLEGTLDRIARALEDRLQDSLVAIHLRDRDLRRLVLAAAPSISTAFAEAVAELPIADGEGACGTAAHLGATVVVEDLLTDERGVDHRDLANDHGLRGCWSVPFTGNDGEVLGTLAVYRSVPHRPDDEELRVTEDLANLVSLVIETLETRRRLLESEERFRLLAEATSDAIWDWDLTTDEMWWSDGLRTLFGYDPEEIPNGNAWSERVHEEDRPWVMTDITRAIDGEEPTWIGEYRFVLRDGEVAHVQDRGSIIRDRRGRGVRMIGGMVDHTERRELEQQYLRAQRMESIGTLASGIAHDLNNVLSPIVMASDLLLHGEMEDEHRETVETIGVSARRGADMVRQVLTFARGLDGERSTVDVAGLLADLERIVRDAFLQDVDVEVVVEPGIWPVHGDATQLQQVLLNLAINAKDAMPDGGRLAITASNLDVEVSPSARLPDLDPGRYVEIRVEDTGTGMSAEVRERAFEPFFTTKSTASGTGLGLATSLAIVRSHGGTVDVHSEAGRGTTFTVRLPRTGDGGEPAPRAERRIPVRGSGQSILVVDDEASVRTVIQQTLEAYGYRVVTAGNGAEAVARYEQLGDEIDLVVTDVMMPGMDGVETIQRLRELDPHVRVIAVSGLTDDGRLPRATEAGAEHLLSKPFSTDTLLRTVAQVLEPAGGAEG